MQDAFLWTRQGSFAAHTLASLRELNHRFLDLAAAHSEQLKLPREAAAHVARLSAQERSAAADCPYALFDLGFHDDAHWRARLGEAWRIADEAAVEEDLAAFVRLALFYAWHVASSTGLAAHLLMGMHGDTANAFRRITVDTLPSLVATEAVNLTARWNGCSAFWSALISAASRADAAALRRVQLSGLQLAAAARLPSG